MAGKTSTVHDVNGKYQVRIDPGANSTLRMTTTNARGNVVAQITVDILKLAHALELATGAKREDKGAPEVSLV